MKHSTVVIEDAPDFFDTAKAVRAAMGAERVSASDLSRTFGGAVSYWTRRMTGQLQFSNRDLELVGWATRTHAAVFMGGEAPAGWTAPEPPPLCPHGDSNSEPTDYYAEGSGVPRTLPSGFRIVRWVPTLIQGGVAS